MIRADLPGAKVIFSTRQGGVSEGPYESLNLGILTDDDQARVTENRSIMAREAGVEPTRVAMGWQVHGSDLLDWDGPPENGGFASPGAELAKVDGHITREPDLGLLVLVADCLPVALAGGGRVAMVHCGWRGLAGGILERAVERFDEPPDVVVGPGIGRCCYEVGEEVLAAFEGYEGVASGRMLDLKAVAACQLADAGVNVVREVDLCTSCRADLFFSHRRDNGVTGRQGGMVWIPAG